MGFARLCKLRPANVNHSINRGQRRLYNRDYYNELNIKAIHIWKYPLESSETALYAAISFIYNL